MVPQIIFICIYLLGIIFYIVEHGKTIKKNNNVYVRILAKAIALGLFWWGGFFKHIDLPQIILVLLIICDIILGIFVHNEEEMEKQDFFENVVWTLPQLILLFWGGFFNIFFSKG